MHREYKNMKTRVGDHIIETVLVVGSCSFDTYLSVVGQEIVMSRVDWSNNYRGAWENHRQWVRLSMLARPGVIAVAIPTLIGM